jgi:hypothetical protein
MKKFYILMIILIPAVVFSQEIGEWRTTKDFTVGDRITSYPDAYALHSVANLYITKKFEDFGVKWWKADLITFSLGVLWEVKDGYVPVEEVPIFGGDGFSSTDIAVNTMVLAANRVIRFGIKKIMPNSSMISLKISYIP